MNISDELAGAPTLVHWELSDDPAQKQGQVGMITSADLENDEVYVSFGKGQQALYGTDALLVLQNQNDIYRYLMTNVSKLTTPEFKDMFRITLLQQTGQRKDAVEALELAKNNPQLQQFTLSSLQQKLGLFKAETQEMETAQTARIGR